MRRPPYTPGTGGDGGAGDASAVDTVQYNCDSYPKHTRNIVRTCNRTELSDFNSQTDCGTGITRYFLLFCFRQ